MTGNPALSVRAAIGWVRRHNPGSWHEPVSPLPGDRVAADFAGQFAGIPANGIPRDEKVVCYRVEESEVPVLLGLYGSAERVRRWLPGLPRQTNRHSLASLIDAASPPTVTVAPACQQRVAARVDITELPVLRATPRDAGPYVTMGLVHAVNQRSGEVALSVHRMLLLGRDRLSIWMVPGRALRRMYEHAVGRGDRLAVSVNIGAPPAAVVASALSTAVLPRCTGKLEMAGAMAGEPVCIAAGVSQPTFVLAESEIVLEGYLDGSTADESVAGPPGVSLPEFLGYDGKARGDLPVLTVTAMTSRRDPLYQAVIGPGREQSVILGLAGAISVALSGDDEGWRMISDLHYSPAGGGMLLLVIAVRKESANADGRLADIAHRIFELHAFVKLIVFTDPDVNIGSTEDVLWAITTRANLGTDCTTFTDFDPLPMDPSQGRDWSRARGGNGTPGRTFIDATIPYALRGKAVRSFSTPEAGA